MSQHNTISSIAMMLAVGAAILFAPPGIGPVLAQTAQQPLTVAPATAPQATTPGAASMPMQQKEQGHGMMGGTSGGQGHPGPMMGPMMGGEGHPSSMMGGQGHAGTPMGSMQSCPAGQTASGNPPTCK